MNRRLLITLVLGFFSGLPIGLTGSTLQAWFAVHQVDIKTIGLLTMLGAPYTCKFMWAPFLDRYRVWGLGFLRRRRSWMVLTQVALGILMAAMGFFSPSVTPGVIALMAFLIAAFSATQDIAIDAYRTELLKPCERGIGAAYVTFSYRLAMMVSGGLALIIAQYVGWQAMFLMMAAVMPVAIVFSCLIRSTHEEVIEHHGFASSFIEPFKAFLQQKYVHYVLLLVLLYKIGDAFSLALTTTFFIRYLDFSLTQVGVIYKICAPISVMAGAFVGGCVLKYVKLYSGLFWFGVLQGIGIAAFVILALVGPNYTMATVAVVLENFTSGLGTVAFFALLMALCDQRYTASQFALLTAIMAISRVFIGPVAGIVVDQFGWVMYYFIGSVLCLLPLLFLLKMRCHRIFQA